MTTQVLLKDHIDTLKGFAFKSLWYTTEGSPIVRVSDFTQDSVDTSNLVRISDVTAANYRRYALRRGDVVIQTVGSWPSNPASVVGKVIRIPSSVDGALLNQNAVKIIPRETIDQGFLYYLLRNPSFSRYIVGCAQGAASQASITLDAIREYRFHLPPRAAQRDIANMLRRYDDLIENNSRRIEILEEMARSLYREWFVEFRFPGHEGVRMVESAVGPIPEGWECLPLGQVADVKWGDTSTTKASYVDEGFDAFSASGLDGKLDHFDFDRTGIVLSAIGAQCGRTWIATGKWSCIKNTMRFWSTSERVSTEYLYFATGNPQFWPRRGAAQPFISQQDAQRQMILIPDASTLDLFNSFAITQVQEVASLERRNANLRQTRDLLLPRLVSGEIDVAGVVEVAGGVGMGG